MYRILFISALANETNIIKEEVKKLWLSNIKTVFYSCGVWNYQTLLHLWKYLQEQEKFDFVINIWVCWYVHEYVKSFFVARIYNLGNKKETIPPAIFDFLDLKSIACSDLPVYDSDVLGAEQFVDMESYAIELLCELHRLPRVLIKVPVDRVWEETKNFDIKKAKKYLAEHIDYRKLMHEVQKYLDTRIKRIDFDPYFMYFDFTFAQKEIFKKLYYRYLACVQNDFDVLFHEYRELYQDKKVFLRTLEKYISNYLIK